MQIAFNSWFLATRPKTLTGALIPVLVGTALALRMKGTFHWEVSFYALMVAFFIQIGTNLFNDVLDYKKGADTKERLGPVRVTQAGLLSPQQVLLGGMMCFVASILFSIPLIIIGGWPITLIMLSSVLCGYLYTGGPKPLAYAGLGEVFVLIFFGLIATGSVFYLQTGSIGFLALLAGAQTGLPLVALLAVNNLRDINQDVKANKLTLPVRFGKTFGRIEISALILCTYLLNGLWLKEGFVVVTLATFLALPIGIQVLRGIWIHEPGKIYNHYFALTALHHLAFGILLTLGLLLS